MLPLGSRASLAESGQYRCTKGNNLEWQQHEGKTENRRKSRQRNKKGRGVGILRPENWCTDVDNTTPPENELLDYYLCHYNTHVPLTAIIRNFPTNRGRRAAAIRKPIKVKQFERFSMFCRMVCLLIWTFTVQLSLYRLVALVYIPLPFQWASLGKAIYLSLQHERRVCRVPTDMNKGRALSCTQPWQVRNETGVYASEGTACSLVDRGQTTTITCLNGRWNKRPSKAISGQFVLRAVPHVILTANVAWLMTYIPHCLSLSLATPILLSAD